VYEWSKSLWFQKQKSAFVSAWTAFLAFVTMWKKVISFSFIVITNKLFQLHTWNLCEIKHKNTYKYALIAVCTSTITNLIMVQISEII
jgi:hypothetical protein